MFKTMRTRSDMRTARGDKRSLCHSLEMVGKARVNKKKEASKKRKQEKEKKVIEKVAREEGWTRSGRVRGTIPPRIRRKRRAQEEEVVDAAGGILDNPLNDVQAPGSINDVEPAPKVHKVNYASLGSSSSQTSDGNTSQHESNDEQSSSSIVAKKEDVQTQAPIPAKSSAIKQQEKCNSSDTKTERPIPNLCTDQLGLQKNENEALANNGSLVSNVQNALESSSSSNGLSGVASLIGKTPEKQNQLAVMHTQNGKLESVADLNDDQLDSQARNSSAGNTEPATSDNLSESDKAVVAKFLSTQNIPNNLLELASKRNEPSIRNMPNALESITTATNVLSSARSAEPTEEGHHEKMACVDKEMDKQIIGPQLEEKTAPQMNAANVGVEQDVHNNDAQKAAMLAEKSANISVLGKFENCSSASQCQKQSEPSLQPNDTISGDEATVDHCEQPEAAAKKLTDNCDQQKNTDLMGDLKPSISDGPKSVDLKTGPSKVGKSLVPYSDSESEDEENTGSSDKKNMGQVAESDKSETDEQQEFGYSRSPLPNLNGAEFTITSDLPGSHDADGSSSSQEASRQGSDDNDDQFAEFKKDLASNLSDSQPTTSAQQQFAHSPNLPIKPMNVDHYATHNNGFPVQKEEFGNSRSSSSSVISNAGTTRIPDSTDFHDSECSTSSQGPVVASDDNDDLFAGFDRDLLILSASQPTTSAQQQFAHSPNLPIKPMNVDHYATHNNGFPVQKEEFGNSRSSYSSVISNAGTTRIPDSTDFHDSECSTSSQGPVVASDDNDDLFAGFDRDLLIFSASQPTTSAQQQFAHSPNLPIKPMNVYHYATHNNGFPVQKEEFGNSRSSPSSVISNAGTTRIPDSTEFHDSECSTSSQGPVVASDDNDDLFAGFDRDLLILSASQPTTSAQQQFAHSPNLPIKPMNVDHYATHNNGFPVQKEEFGNSRSSYSSVISNAGTTRIPDSTDFHDSECSTSSQGPVVASDDNDDLFAGFDRDLLIFSASQPTTSAQQQFAHSPNLPIKPMNVDHYATHNNGFPVQKEEFGNSRSSSSSVISNAGTTRIPDSTDFHDSECSTSSQGPVVASDDNDDLFAGFDRDLLILSASQPSTSAQQQFAHSPNLPTEPIDYYAAYNNAFPVQENGNTLQPHNGGYYSPNLPPYTSGPTNFNQEASSSYNGTPGFLHQPPQNLQMMPSTSSNYFLNSYQPMTNYGNFQQGLNTGGYSYTPYSFGPTASNQEVSSSGGTDGTSDFLQQPLQNQHMMPPSSSMNAPLQYQPMIYDWDASQEKLAAENKEKQNETPIPEVVDLLDSDEEDDEWQATIKEEMEEKQNENLIPEVVDLLDSDEDDDEWQATIKEKCTDVPSTSSTNVSPWEYQSSSDGSPSQKKSGKTVSKNTMFFFKMEMGGMKIELEIVKKDVTSRIGCSWFTDNLIMLQANRLLWQASTNMIENVKLLDCNILSNLLDKELEVYWNDLNKKVLDEKLGAKKMRRERLFEKEMLIIPCNSPGEKHWVLVVVVDPANCLVHQNEVVQDDRTCSVFFLDPMGALIRARRDKMLTIVKKFLWNHHEHRRPSLPTEFVEEKIIMRSIKNLPLQDNFYDCGPATLHYLEGILDNRFGLVAKKRGTKENVLIRRREDLSNVDWSEYHPQPQKAIEMVRHKIRGVFVKTSSTEEERERMEVCEKAFMRVNDRHRVREWRTKRSFSVGAEVRRMSLSRGRWYSVDALEKEENGDGIQDRRPYSSPKEVSEMPASIAARKKNEKTYFEYNHPDNSEPLKISFCLYH